MPALELEQKSTAPSMTRRTSILTGLAGATALASLAATASAAEENPELEKVRALLKAHDEAMKNQDLPGILALMSEKTAIMGTGPGEIWSGPEEIKAAYEHFFQGFDKGEQGFEYQFKIGNLGTDMGWLMASGNIKGKKDGKEFEFPINLSLTVSKSGGKWLIASMHFSTFTSADKK
jgi:ketosteroid isomerase-like protein